MKFFHPKHKWLVFQRKAPFWRHFGTESIVRLLAEGYPARDCEVWGIDNIPRAIPR